MGAKFVNENIKHLPGRSKEEIINLFLDVNMWDTEEYFHKAIYEIEKIYGMNELDWHDENEDVCKKVKNKFQELFNDALEYHMS